VTQLQKNSVVATLYFIFLLLAQSVTAEKFIYIEDKPEIWLYPHDPVYQAWYKHADLIQLVNMMQASGKESLVLFTKSALHQLAMLYEQEIMKSNQEEGASAGENYQKSRWRHTAREYAQQLQQVATQIDFSSDIELYIEEYGEPTVVIDKRPYILTAPDLKKSGLLYTAIIDDLCSKGVCLQNNNQQEDEIDKIKTIINAEWKISTTEPPEYFSEDGLYFVFTNLENRKRKQKVCLQIMRELGLITASLMEISKKGISIDWEVINLERIYGSYRHKLIINGFGDSMVIDLIYLGQSKPLLIETISWMQAQVQGEDLQKRFEHADILLSEFIK
jgi:hypothetical protein